MLGVKPDATREVLGLYNAPTESAYVWGEIIDDLQQRGLVQCDLFVTDNLTGFDDIIESRFEKTHIQKCVLHLKRNVLSRTKKIHRQAIADNLKKVFDMEDKNDAIDKAQQRAIDFYHKWISIYLHIKIFGNI